MRDLKTAKQVAEHFCVAEITVYQWKNRGCPHTFRGINRILFNLQEVQDWIEEQRGTK